MTSIKKINKWLKFIPSMKGWNKGWGKPIRSTIGCGDINLLIYWLALDGFISDWKIEKRIDTCKPYILAKVCTNQRYGAFNNLSSAKIVAYLLDYK